MNLFKCKCGLLTSKEFKVCPSCGNEEKKSTENVYDLNKEVFTITMEDVNNIIKDSCFEDELREFSEEQIMDKLRHKLEIPWNEYVECVLDTYFLDA